MLGRIPQGLLDTIPGDDDYPPFGDVASEGSGESPNAPVLLRDLSVEVDVGSDVSTARTWRLGIAAASGHPTPALTCQMIGADTTCDSGDQTVLVPAGSQLVLRQSVNGAQATQTEARFGYRALTP